MEESFEVVIVGAGSSGLCTAIKLKEAGISDFIILEKGILHTASTNYL